MKIVYLGNFTRSWSTETHVARELEGLGHTVERIQEHSGMGVSILDYAIERLPDLFLWTKTHPLPPKAVDVFRQLEDFGTKTASFHLDVYVGLPREVELFHDPFWRTGTVFTPDGDPNSARVFEGLGIHHVWSPAAVVSDEVRVGRYEEDLASDVVFVGSYPYPHAWPWRGELVDYLAARYGRSFRVVGSSNGIIRGQDLNDLYASSKVVVGDSFCPDTVPTPDGGRRRHERYWSDRPYETLGRGGFLLFPWIRGIDDHFVDGVHFRTFPFGNLDAVGELVDEYLDRPEDREIIAARGLAHVAEKHTYRHRLERVLRIVEGEELP